MIGALLAQLYFDKYINQKVSISKLLYYKKIKSS